MKYAPRAVITLTALLGSAALAAAKSPPPVAIEGWPVDVPGFIPVEPGEHPRLFFRKSDLPAQRAKMKTPEGQTILARLKQTLGGGEAMPTATRGAAVPFGDKSPSIEQPLGAYSIGHASRFGLLYQLTGEKIRRPRARVCRVGIRRRARQRWQGPLRLERLLRRAPSRRVARLVCRRLRRLGRGFPKKGRPR